MIKKITFVIVVGIFILFTCCKAADIQPPATLDTCMQLPTTLNTLGIPFCADFSPDSKRIIAGTHAGVVQIWDVGTGSEILNVRGCLKPGISWVAFSPNGKSFVAVGWNSGMYDQKIKVCDANSGAEIVKLQNSNKHCQCSAFSIDGKHLIAIDTVTGGTFRIWEIPSGKEIIAQGPNASGPCTMSCLDIDPRGNRFIAGNTIRKLTGEKVLSLTGRVCPASIAFNSNGTRVATGHHDGVIRLWETEKGKEVMTLKEHEGRVSAVDFSPDGRYLVSGGFDKTVRIWDLAIKASIIVNREHKDIVFSAKFSSNGKMIISSSRNNTIQVVKFDRQ